MATYLNTETQDYPRHEGDLYLLGWSDDQPLPENWVEVVIDPVPDVAPEQTYELQAPSLIDGAWRAVYIVRDLTVDELAKVQARDAAIAELKSYGVRGNRLFDPMLARDSLSESDLTQDAIDTLINAAFN